MILLLYLCRTWEGEARALDAASLRWTEPAEMPRLPMPPADQPLIGQLEALLRASA
jgi:8-oxo-dGTP diphosphatase